MSLETFLGDVFTGNFSNAAKRLEDWWSGFSPLVKSFVQKMASDEGKILEGLVGVAAQDVISGGLTTASFVSAAKDVGTKLVAQNITMAQTDIFAALNTAVGMAQASSPSSSSPASTEAPPASPDPVPAA